MTWGITKSNKTNRRWMLAATLMASSVALSGCAEAVIGSLTIGQISTIAGVTSAATTGRGLQDHALSAVTGQDCRLVEGIFRENRRICEEPGSPATEDDFRGIVAMLTGANEDEPSEGTPEEDAETTLANAENTGEEVSEFQADSDVAITFSALSSDFRPALTRKTRRTAEPAVLSLDYAGEVPSLQDWVNAQPTPMITTISLTRN